MRAHPSNPETLFTDPISRSSEPLGVTEEDLENFFETEKKTGGIHPFSIPTPHSPLPTPHSPS
jgi:hypothetical protein